MDNNLNILIVDDEKEYLQAIQSVLLTNDYTSHSVNSGEEAIALIRKTKVDVVIIDYKMKDINGFELVDKIKEISPDTEVIVITVDGDIKSAVEAIKKGAFGYFIKNHDLDELILEIKKIEKVVKYKNKVESLSAQNFFLESENESFNKALDLASRAADSNSTILLLGESGVGKEVFANYIHNLSSRKNNTFVAVNCHAFSENLLQSELYGHEKGAFTGAYEKRIGRIEAAHEGTLFLDEIGDTSLDVQLNLLRVLDNRKIARIGSNRLIDIDFRLICATNKDISRSIKENNFREDFYYRISTIVIKIPPLRDRKEDLKKLINYFITTYASELKKDIQEIEEEALNTLMSYNYPGNIRELKNIIERLVVLSKDGIISIRDISDEINMNVSNRVLLKDVRAAAEKKHIEKLLLINNFNMTNTASQLGISRRQLFNKINEYSIDKH
ncbi:DNA-binding transcriptional response regulator, NtrC family, contains REC, AAA-type ATPase, and a Fis-type DNA-binding domains [Anaerovirgula multivorans]|uniref:Stage 0 sporulation protein A homolog n=1 Tax=Anaerovirgula multivorans TaxID=312168 RepID=A0A239FSU0_9FIRM|nr:sigma-54 dependent transcriptional regulator [Anaerovirgula multivorans]SNS60156.1 DNA-binding transcriptional response regulator, NtrC family, contains REC, AAA-type ATPase, and a Fis-type DNA-binding domains [Anaerovirgula multivorans]